MKICLCGSTRFMDQFNAANRSLTLAGHVVYSVAAVSTGNHSEITHDEKLALDAVHLSKIEESDAVMIVGIQEDGSVYIGDSTRREMMYARLREKSIYFYEPGAQVAGPVREFQNDLKGAAMTNADREEQKRAEEARQAQFLATFKMGGEDEVDHSGDPEAPAEEVRN
jgi:hypothetical protein